ncbi:FAD-binding protein [Nordella sp. HKS 07]|uniref:FAD-binding oxidoreductase n=1 Tax=Nordella sp. HKS 07 TaxID=2712222 RepID=UPI0013E1B2DC|nr:FAD-linked oxidase C-terminal domain-containing protein [Nordella sp. HKS 07]QIG49004.1 FAD-binding protein [Nordella sp. HKS 07]
MNETTRSRLAPAARAQAIAELAATFGNRLVTSQPVRQQHGNTTTWIVSEPPDAVIYPQSSAEVQQIVQICARHFVPIIPFGAGTSFEGHVNAPFGGVSIDLKDMNQVLEVHAEDFDCVVQPGITRKRLNEHLRDQGLFFPVDPGADASLGGMASTRASGTTAVRYGTMKDNVLALVVVLASGEVMTTSRRARKSSAGYDLTRLIVGAEGTLGVITEMTLKLHAIPEAISAGVCAFPSVQAACGAAIAAIQVGIPVARVELLDEVQIRSFNAYSKLSMPETPMLFLEFHGSDASVAEQAECFGEVARDYDGSSFQWATSLEERTRLWQARHDVFWANSSFRLGARTVATDVCVPISRLAECVTETKRDIEASGLVAPIVGHAGDGNFHASVLVMMEDADEVARTQAFIERIAERALAMEGTCTGEHGIGQGKKHFLEAEHGSSAIEAMRAIKNALDPNGIMNPGKIV